MHALLYTVRIAEYGKGTCPMFYENRFIRLDSASVWSFIIQGEGGRNGLQHFQGEFEEKKKR